MVFLKIVTGRLSGRAAAKIFRGMRSVLGNFVGKQITDRHCKHEQCTWQYRRCRNRRIGVAAKDANEETQKDADNGFEHATYPQFLSEF